MRKIKYKLDQLNFLINHSKSSKSLIEDIYGLINLDNLFTGKPILPTTEKSLRPFELQFIINEVIINKRKNIIEFGSGISTIIIARLLQHNKLEGKLLSVEHDEEWMNVIQTLLRSEKLGHYVELVHAPLVESELESKKIPWYDKNKINLPNRTFDLVLIDGPPSFSKNVELSRYFALPFIHNHLSTDNSIMLDDAQRSGEKIVIKKWEKEFGFNFTTYSNSFAVAYSGNFFVSNPLKGNER
jgi:predicted O-methyltransferase YrrM